MKTKKITEILLIICCLLALVASGFAMHAGRVCARTEDLVETNGTSAETDATAPDGLAEAGRKGLKLTASRAGARFSFARTFAGNFEMEFRPLSETIGERDYGKLILAVTDTETGKGFRVHIGEKDEFSYASVEYLGNVKDFLNLPISFSNEGELLKFAFDPLTGEVSISSGDVSTTVARFQDLATMMANHNTHHLPDPINTYRVEVEFSELEGTNLSNNSL